MKAVTLWAVLKSVAVILHLGSDCNFIVCVVLSPQLFLMCYVDVIEYQIASELGSQTAECEDLTILWR